MTDYTLLEQDVQILVAIHQHKGITREQLQKLLDLNQSKVQKACVRMVERGFAESIRLSGTRQYEISITQSGRKALVAHHRNQRMFRAEVNVAQPARINIFAQPVLTLQRQGYCRNDGNKHIKSAGRGC